MINHTLYRILIDTTWLHKKWWCTCSKKKLQGEPIQRRIFDHTNPMGINERLECLALENKEEEQGSNISDPILRSNRSVV